MEKYYDDDEKCCDHGEILWSLKKILVIKQ